MIERTPCLVVFMASIMMMACGDPPPSKYPSVAPEITMPKLGMGDKIRIRIEYGANKDQIVEREYVLDASGEIAVPYIDVVAAADRSVSELRNEIKERLADGYLKKPIVWIDVLEISSVQISVMGQVKTQVSTDIGKG